MQKNKKIALWGLALLGLFSIGAVSFAYAYGGNNQVGPNYSAERHSLMERAFATNDYNLWRSQVGSQGVTQKINANNFAQFAEAHRLQEQGRYAEAREIRTKLGLGNGGGCGNCDSENCGNKNGSCTGGCGMNRGR